MSPKSPDGDLRASGRALGTTGTPARFQLYVGAEGYLWRLLGRNNRACGRSMSTVSTLDEVKAGARLAARAAALGAVDLTSSVGREWSWVLLLDGQPVARSDASYGRRVECVAGVARFRVVAPTAALSDLRMARSTTDSRLSWANASSVVHPGR